MTAAPSHRLGPVRTGDPEPPLRAVLDAALDAVILVNGDGTIRLWNRQAEALLGWKAVEVIGRTLSSLIVPEPHGEDRAHALARLLAAGGAPQAPQRGDVHTRHRDGHAVPVELGISPIAGESRFVVCLRDNTERRRRDEVERFQSRILENVHDSVIVVDLQGRVEYWNQGAERLYGYTTQEMLGRSVGAILPEDVSAKADLERVLVAGQLSEEVRRRCKDGTSLWVESRRWTMHDARGAVVGALGVATDITQRKRVAAELQESRAQLRNLADRLRRAREEERASIARQIHDEMGQVLTALRLDVSWLEAHIPGGERRLRDKCHTMERLIVATIGQVRSLATELRPAVLDDLGLPAAIEWGTAEFARRSGIACDLHLPDELADVDRDRATDLFRILQEALTNVARHAGARRVEVRLRVRRRREELVLQVNDDGRGITAEEAGDPRSLGLVGMRERALLWNGSVEVRAGRTGGTRVLVRLPLGRGERPA